MSDIELTLNSDHRIRYFSDFDPSKVLRSARRFIKDNEIDNVTALTMTLQWDDEADCRRYDAYLIYGGF